MSGLALMTKFNNGLTTKLRRTIMLTLKDLSVSKELDCEALAEVRGGSIYNTTVQSAYSVGSGGLVGISDVDQWQDVINNDSDFSLSEDYAFNIASPAGFAWT